MESKMIGKVGDKTFEGLKGYIEGIRYLLRDSKTKQSSFYDFVLRNALHFVIQELTEEEKAILKKTVFFKPKVKECYYNAQSLTLQDHKIRYFEGWAISKLGIPLEHAWNVFNGKVIDVTWDDGREYFGIEIPAKFIAKQWLKKEMSEPMLLDWFLQKGENK